MNKKTRNALIVALSLFGVGVIICLCVSISVHFDYSKLTDSFYIGASSGEKLETEHVDKDIKADGQDIKFNLSSADVTVTPSEDDMIHISYNNTEDNYFEFKEKDGSITLTQKGNRVFLFWSINLEDAESEVTLSIPMEHDGSLNINGASSDISISDIDITEGMGIYSVSGEISILNCKSKTLETGSTSGEIDLAALETDSIKASSVSGGLNLSDISGSIPVTLASTSGEVYAENVNTKNLGIETISGEITLKNVDGLKASLSTTSGGAELAGADFTEIKFKTVSGEISGTVSGSAEDYTVYTDTVSGSDSLSSHKGSGDRTLDFSSVSGSFDVGFEK